MQQVKITQTQTRDQPLLLDSCLDPRKHAISVIHRDRSQKTPPQFWPTLNTCDETHVTEGSGEKLPPHRGKTIETTPKECNISTTQARAQRRFILTVGVDGLKFNHTVQFYNLFLDPNPVLHMVELATHFSAGVFPKRHSTTEIYRNVRKV